ncbi:MAG: DUF1508 domain-containing protein [Novosphingobium sp.]
MPHRFEIRKNTIGEYVAYFCHNSEPIFWTEGYRNRRDARRAIDSILDNGPSAEIIDNSDD